MPCKIIWDEITYPFPNFNSCTVDKWFHFTLYNGCNYLFMLGLKLIHVNAKGPEGQKSKGMVYKRLFFLYMIHSHCCGGCWDDDIFSVGLGASYFNTLRPRQHGRHFADDTFKCIFLNENVIISITISLKFVPKGPINNITALVQIMAWCRPGDKPLSEAMMVSLLTHICVTRPPWVKWVI